MRFRRVRFDVLQAGFLVQICCSLSVKHTADTFYAIFVSYTRLVFKFTVCRNDRSCSANCSMAAIETKGDFKFVVLLPV